MIRCRVNIYCACVLFLCVLLRTVICANGTYKGELTTNCARHYYRILVTRVVPPRNYRYFHEVMPIKDVSSEIKQSRLEDSGVKFRIVGGQSVSIKQVPYQVLYGLYCGGTLIAPDWVLTAAHCKEKDNFILAGSTFRSKTTRYPICAHFLHPLWAAANTTHPHDFDYQLLLLEKAVPVTPKSRPIAIGDLNDVHTGQMIAVSGWGHTQYKQRAMQDIIRRVFVPIMSEEECKSLPLANYKTITPRMFCAGYFNGTKDSCQGDSGGPAVANGKLIGLVSFGIGCAERAQPGVYTIIPTARDWIRKITSLPL